MKVLMFFFFLFSYGTFLSIFLLSKYDTYM